MEHAMKRLPLAVSLALALAACGRDASPPADTAATPAGAPPTTEAALIPRDVIFGNPERSGAKIGHDGKRVAYLAPLDGVMNVYVAPFEDAAAAKPVTKETTRPIRQYAFAYDGKHL